MVGYGTSIFPAFWLRESGFELDWRGGLARTRSPQIMAARDELGSREGLVVANPIPAEQQWDPAEHDRVLAAAFAAADAAGVRGKAVTPFLLRFIVDASGGRSLEVNLDLARNNVRVAPTSRPPGRRGAPPRERRPIVVVGDVINDIVVVPRGEIRADTDTASTIRPRPGGSAANTAAWLGSLGVPVDFVGRVGIADVEYHAQLFREHGVTPVPAGRARTADRHDRHHGRRRAPHDAHRARRQRRALARPA